MLEEKLSVKKAEKQKGALELEAYSQRLDFEEKRRKAELQSISARARKMNELHEKVFKIDKVNESRMEKLIAEYNAKIEKRELARQKIETEKRSR